MPDTILVDTGFLWRYFVKVTAIMKAPRGCWQGD